MFDEAYENNIKKLGKKNFLYHYSSVAYLPGLINSRFFIPGNKLLFRREQRLQKVLSKLTTSKINELNSLDANSIDFSRTRGNYVWLTTSINYALKHALQISDRELFVKNRFTDELKKAPPIIYVFPKNLDTIVNIKPETHINYNSQLYNLRSFFRKHVRISTEPIPFDAISFALVRKNDQENINNYLSSINHELKLIPVLETRL